MDRKINIEKLLLYIGLIGVLIYGIHTYKEVNKPFRNQDVMEEMKNDKVSKSKLTRFREKIENIHPELQLGSTLLAAISTASDVIQTITNT